MDDDFDWDDFATAPSTLPSDPSVSAAPSLPRVEEGQPPSQPPTDEISEELVFHAKEQVKEEVTPPQFEQHGQPVDPQHQQQRQSLPQELQQSGVEAKDIWESFADYQQPQQVVQPPVMKEEDQQQQPEEKEQPTELQEQQSVIVEAEDEWESFADYQQPQPQPQPQSQSLSQPPVTKEEEQEQPVLVTQHEVEEDQHEVVVDEVSKAQLQEQQPSVEAEAEWESFADYQQPQQVVAQQQELLVDDGHKEEENAQIVAAEDEDDDDWAAFAEAPAVAVDSETIITSKESEQLVSSQEDVEWDAFEDSASSTVQPAHSLTPAGVEVRTPLKKQVEPPSDNVEWDAFEASTASAVEHHEVELSQLQVQQEFLSRTLEFASQFFPPFEKVAPQETTSEVDYGAIDQWLTSVPSSSSRDGFVDEWSKHCMDEVLLKSEQTQVMSDLVNRQRFGLPARILTKPFPKKAVSIKEVHDAGGALSQHPSSQHESGVSTVGDATVVSNIDPSVDSVSRVEGALSPAARAFLKSLPNLCYILESPPQ